jgi:hypothetical protein
LNQIITLYLDVKHLAIKDKERTKLKKEQKLQEVQERLKNKRYSRQLELVVLKKSFVQRWRYSFVPVTLN